MQNTNKIFCDFLVESGQHLPGCSRGGEADTHPGPAEPHTHQGDDDKEGLGNKVRIDSTEQDIVNNNFRDAAVESKNAAEVDLARNRIEMMQVGKHVEYWIVVYFHRYDP